MEPNTSTIYSKTSARDFFLHLGSMIGLYSVAISIINVLFTIIDKAYPQISTYSDYSSYSYSISFPVASMIIMFPVFIFLMWLLEKTYNTAPEKKHTAIKKWLTYITLFVSGLVTTGDLVTLVYYFIDGQEITTGFVLKILSVLAISVAIFMYYISDVRNTLTASSRKLWRVSAFIIVIGTIITGFVVLGSPRSQQLIRYDERKVSDLERIETQINSYYYTTKKLPENLAAVQSSSTYDSVVYYNDQQTMVPYEYIKKGDTTYSLCAVFNTNAQDKSMNLSNIYSDSQTNRSTWTSYTKGHYCFTRTVQESPFEVPVTIPTKGV